MAASLTVTTTILEDQILVEADVAEGGDIPQAIFLYENTGTDELGKYFGVCSRTDYERFQEWTGTPIPVFGNKFVRYTVGRNYVPLGTSTAGIEKNMVDSCKKFRLEYLGMTIPVTRSYNL